MSIQYDSADAAAAQAPEAHEATAFRWQGFKTYDDPKQVTIHDDDDKLDWYGQDSGSAETMTVDGQVLTIKWSGTIETKFTDSEGHEHVEDLIYSYTSDGYYVMPMAGSAFDAGSTITCFTTNSWKDTDGIEYEEVICFTPACRIQTARGPVPAGSLRAGDLLQTADNGLQPLRWIGRSDLPGLKRIAANLHPVRIRQDAFGPGQPARDILVSPQHRICLRGDGLHFPASEWLAPAKGLVDGKRITRDRAARGISYVHLLLDRHEVLFCEGLATESFQPSDRTRATLSAGNRAALEDVTGPDLRPWKAARSTLRPWEGALLSRVS